MAISKEHKEYLEREKKLKELNDIQIKEECRVLAELLLDIYEDRHKDDHNDPILYGSIPEEFWKDHTKSKKHHLQKPIDNGL